MQSWEAAQCSRAVGATLLPWLGLLAVAGTEERLGTVRLHRLDIKPSDSERNLPAKFMLAEQED